MKLPRILLACAIILVGCNSQISNTGRTPSPAATHTIPSAAIETTHTPDAKVTAHDFLTAWQTDDYTKMYALLTKLSRDAISETDFAAKYTDAATNLTLNKLDFQVLSSLTTPASAQVAYQVTFHTNLLGDIQREITMNLSQEDNTWKVQWEDGLIMPELKGGNKLALQLEPAARGNIYDRNGHAIASQSEAVQFWVNTGELDPKQQGTLLTEMSRLTNQTPEHIQSLFQPALDANQNWPIILGEATSDDVQARLSTLSAISGLHMGTYRARYYPDGGVAAPVIGYELLIQPDQLAQFKRQGYRGDEAVGAAGMEQWGENYLAGKPHATLHVVDSQGAIITMLADVDAQPADSIYTTLDKDLQEQTEKAISGFKGAAVVLERDTGRVLAIASSPSFDPNAYSPTLPRSVGDNGDQFDRAVQGQYPPGSVFKIVTMAAALESGLFTQNSTFDCQYAYTELEGDVIYDWTQSYGQPPSGMLTLPQGLMRSCNPWFAHIGLTLFRQKGADFLATMAKGFGLGSVTGINGGIGERAGNVEDPPDESQAIRAAFGQSTLLVTPLQIADYVAAVGNGGTLYTPQIVGKIAPVDGDPVFTFKPEVKSKLPVSADNLKIIQDAMRSVVADNRGTAHFVFAGMQIPIYGKTGTAQNPGDKPHAWFVAYTDAKRTDKPDIAVAVVIENVGEGADYAAPITRRILEDYFSGQPSRLYPWESSYYVTKTPTPEGSATATPEPPTAVPATETPVP